MLFWFVPLEGESEANNDVKKGEEDQGEEDLAEREKEASKGGF